MLRQVVLAPTILSIGLLGAIGPSAAESIRPTSSSGFVEASVRADSSNVCIGGSRSVAAADSSLQEINLAEQVSLERSVGPGCEAALNCTRQYCPCIEACSGTEKAAVSLRSHVTVDSVVVWGSVDIDISVGYLGTGEALGMVTNEYALRFTVDSYRPYYCLRLRSEGWGVPLRAALRRDNVLVASIQFCSRDCRAEGKLPAGDYVLDVKAYGGEYLGGGVVVNAYSRLRFQVNLTFNREVAVTPCTWAHVKSLYQLNDGPSNHMLQPPAPRAGQR